MAGGEKGGGLGGPVDHAGGEVDVVGTEGGADLVDADAPGSEGAGIDADADGVFLRAEDIDLGDAVDGGDALGENGLGEFVDFGEGESFGGEGEQENRVVVGVGLSE